MSVSAETTGLCLVSQVTAADTRAIEDGLNELWRLAEAGELGGAIVRSASMTFLVPMTDSFEADGLATMLDGLADAYPARAMLLLSNEDVPEPRARLSSHFRRAGEGDPTRYWEEIRLVSAPGGLNQVMSLVAILALPGLPIQTWWPSEPTFEGDLFNHIVEVSDRMILDSSRFTRVASALPQLAAAIEVAHQSVAFADLSWTRLTPWRLLAAEFFDPAEDQELLDSIQRVRVEYTSEYGGEAAQALLLIGWLASRLGWEPSGMTDGEAGCWAFDVIDGVRPVRIEIVQVVGGEWAVGLHAITIEAEEGARRATYTVERRGRDEAHTIRIAESRQEGYAHLLIQDQAELLREALGGFASDRIYQESLSLVARLFGER